MALNTDARASAYLAYAAAVNDAVVRALKAPAAPAATDTDRERQ